MIQQADWGGIAGVTSFDVSLEKQEVLVNGPIEYDPLLAIIKKTGKEVSKSVGLATEELMVRLILQVRSGEQLE